MSDTLRAALESVQTHLEAGIAEAQIELADARALRRELRQRVAIVRQAEPLPPRARLVVTSPEAAPEPASITEPTESEVVPESAPIAEPPSLGVTPALAPISELASLEVGPEPELGPIASVTTSNPPLAVVSPRRSEMPQLPRRWVLALGAVGRLDLDRLPRLLARNIIVRWEGSNTLGGTHLGHAKALAFVRKLEPLVDRTSVRVVDVHADGSNVEITVGLTLQAPTRANLRVETRLSVVARFDPAGMITLLFATPNDPAAVDEFLDVTMADNFRSA